MKIKAWAVMGKDGHINKLAYGGLAVFPSEQAASQECAIDETVIPVEFRLVDDSRMDDRCPVCGTLPDCKHHNVDGKCDCGDQVGPCCQCTV